MLLKTFDTLEQALLKLQAHVAARPPAGATYKGPPDVTPIHPARHDTAAINGMAKQILKKIALTDKQQVFAIKLVTKYRKQWKKAGFDVSNIDLNTPLSMPVRTGIDRTHVVSVENNIINLKFPYKPNLIGLVAEYANNSRGHVTYEEKTKLWKLTATAANLKWAEIFVKDHKFTTTPSYLDLVNLVDEGYDYNSIQLDIVDGELILHDAPKTMLEWIDLNIGEITMSNFVRIAAVSNVLAFTLSDSVVDHVIDTYPDIADIILMRRSFVSSGSTTLTELLQKVKRLEYNNIVIFVTDQSSFRTCMESASKAMPDHNIVATSMKEPQCDFTSNKTVYITNRVVAVPADLIISMAGFMAGPSRRNWFNSATKNIYYCQDIDDKIKKQLKKDESNINYKRRNKR